MSGDEFLEYMEGIDPAYIAAADAMPQRTKPYLKWCSAAACALLLVLSVFALLQPNNPLPEIEPPTEIQVTEPTTNSSPFSASLYNCAQSSDIERLTDSELEPFLPDAMLDWMEPKGFVRHQIDATGEVVGSPVIWILFRSRRWNGFIEVGVGERQEIARDAPLDGSFRESSASASEKIVTAYYCSETLIYSLNAVVSNEDAENAKRDITQIRNCLIQSKPNPDLRLITPKGDYADQRTGLLSTTRAMGFVLMMRKALSNVSSIDQVGVFRFIDFSNVFSGRWACGDAEISCTVSCFVDGDAARIMDATDDEIYDLQQYISPSWYRPYAIGRSRLDPIFNMEDLTPDIIRARLLPPEDCPDDGNTHFGFTVKIGNILLRIHACNFSPEQLCEHFTEIYAEILSAKKLP